MILKAGTMLQDRYEILEKIGSGGMSDVYKAKCHKLNRLVAIKVLKAEFTDDANFVSKFKMEAQAAAGLSHPNIVSIYDVVDEGDIHFIVMELVEGITLKSYITKKGRLDVKEAIGIAIQVAQGIEAAHEQHIIHRDIKPQNMLISMDGKVKVADFGIARAVSSQTMNSTVVGSVHYISPEQARGDRIDARSDIYSAGVVLYEMLTGRLPFEGDSAVSVAIQHLSSVPLAPRDIDPDIPEPLELICMKAMNSDPDKRYPTADAILEDLEKFRKDPTVDMDYIRKELTAVQPDSEPTMPLPTAQVATAVKKRTEQVRRDEPEEDVRFRDKKSIAIMAGIFVAALVLVFLLFKLILGDFGPAGNNKSYEVPDVRGMTVEEAQLTDGVKDVFEIVVKGALRSDAYAAGQIVEQSPEAGRSRKSNFVIEVYVAAEEEKVPMPEMTGKEYRQARIELQELNLDLQLEFLSQNSDTRAKDTVISTVPEAGEQLKKGQKITLYISTGPKSVTVPSFVGEDIAIAIKDAQDMGLTVGQPAFDPYTEVETGRITDQSIQPGEVVDGGTQIVFTVSGTGEEDIVTRTKTVEFSLPEDMDGMIKVEFEQDGAIVDSQYLSSNLKKTSYTFTGQVGRGSLVRAYFTCINDNTVASSPSQEITF